MKRKSVIQWITLLLSFAILCVALVNNKYFNWRYRLILFFAALALIMFVLLVSKRLAVRMAGAVIILVVAGVLFYSQYSLGNIMTPLKKRYSFLSIVSPTQ